MHYFSFTHKCNVTEVCGEEGASASSALWSLALGHNRKDKISNENGWNDFAAQGGMAWCDVTLGAQSRNTGRPHWEEPDDVARASVSDAAQTHPLGGV